MQKRAKTREMRADDKTHQAKGGETQASETETGREKDWDIVGRREREIKGEDGSVCVYVSQLHLWVILSLSVCFDRHLCRLRFL